MLALVNSLRCSVLVVWQTNVLRFICVCCSLAPKDKQKCGHAACIVWRALWLWLTTLLTKLCGCAIWIRTRFNTTFKGSSKFPGGLVFRYKEEIGGNRWHTRRHGAIVNGHRPAMEDHHPDHIHQYSKQLTFTNSILFCKLRENKWRFIMDQLEAFINIFHLTIRLARAKRVSYSTFGRHCVTDTLFHIKQQWMRTLADTHNRPRRYLLVETWFERRHIAGKWHCFLYYPCTHQPGRAHTPQGLDRQSSPLCKHKRHHLHLVPGWLQEDMISSGNPRTVGCFVAHRPMTQHGPPHTLIDGQLV
jgi:hypothetical protein